MIWNILAIIAGVSVAACIGTFFRQMYDTLRAAERFFNEGAYASNGTSSVMASLREHIRKNNDRMNGNGPFIVVKIDGEKK